MTDIQCPADFYFDQVVNQCLSCPKLCTEINGLQLDECAKHCPVYNEKQLNGLHEQNRSPILTTTYSYPIPQASSASDKIDILLISVIAGLFFLSSCGTCCCVYWIMRYMDHRDKKFDRSDLQMHEEKSRKMRNRNRKAITGPQKEVYSFSDDLAEQSQNMNSTPFSIPSTAQRLPPDGCSSGSPEGPICTSEESFFSEEMECPNQMFGEDHSLRQPVPGTQQSIMRNSDVSLSLSLSTSPSDKIMKKVPIPQSSSSQNQTSQTFVKEPFGSEVSITYPRFCSPSLPTQFSSSAAAVEETAPKSNVMFRIYSSNLTLELYTADQNISSSYSPNCHSLHPDIAGIVSDDPVCSCGNIGVDNDHWGQSRLSTLDGSINTLGCHTHCQSLPRMTTNGNLLVQPNEPQGQVINGSDNIAMQCKNLKEEGDAILAKVKQGNS